MLNHKDEPRALFADHQVCICNPFEDDGWLYSKLPFGKNTGEAKYIQSLLKAVEGMGASARKNLLRKARDMAKSNNGK